MTDTSTAAEQARIAAETEASREVQSQAAPDSPNPMTDDGGQITDVRGQMTEERVDPSSDIRHLTSEAKPLERVTAFDRGRADIAARFKEKRAAQGGTVDYHGDMRDPTQTYGPFADQMTDDRGPPPARGQARTEEPPAQVAQESPTTQPAPLSSDIRPPSSEPRLVKVKVHGRESFLPEADVIAEAQKSLAAGNILETAKEFLQGAKRTTDDQSASPSEPASAKAGLPSPPYSDLVQDLQLGEPGEAGRRLQQTIESKIAAARQEAAREAARAVRIDSEIAASQRTLSAFEQANLELAADEFARDAITTQVQREINADLQAALKSGVLSELPRTQEERNGLHTQLRAFGAPVRGMADIMESAKTKYASWRGDKPASAQATQLSAAGAAPRVELSPDRAQRRAAIPTQPGTASVPPRAPALAPELNQAQRRSAAIMNMRKARGQIVA